MVDNKKTNKRHLQPANVNDGYGHVQPQEIDLERAVLGALMIDREALAKVKDILVSDSFYEPRNQYIYDAILALNTRQSPIDFLTVTEELKSNGTLEDAGGVIYVTEISSSVASSASVEYHAKVIHDCYIRRQIIHKTSELQTAAFDRTIDIGDTLEKIDSLKKELDQDSGDYLQLMNVPSEAEWRKELADEPCGITVDLSFKAKNDDKVQLLFPSDGVTIFGALTSHGKSRALENTALEVAMNSDEGSVLYFTYEENKNSIYRELLNIYANMELSKNNLNTIAQYFKGNMQYFSHDTSIAEFQEKEKKFMRDIILSGRLVIINKDYDSKELLRALNAISKKRKIKAVFVDYIQLLYTNGNTRPRNEELKGIGKGLMNFATDNLVPVIVAAQLNRETTSPAEMQNQNIADSADLERVAQVIVLLWNSAFKPLNKSDVTKAAQVEEKKDFKLGVPGKIYAFLSKNRKGNVGADALWNFNGNTGVITDENNKPLGEIGDKKKKEIPVY